MLPYLIAGAIGYGIAKLFEEDETPKYDEGGLVGNIFTQIIYYALLNTETDTEVYAEGNDLEEIQKQYNSIISSDFNNPNSNYNSKLLESRINQYEFIGGDDLNAEDYIDDLENTDYWNLTDENYNVIETDSVFAINNSTDEMIDEIREFIKQEYNIGGRYAEKYMRINIYDENEDYINDLQIRIADHSQNPKNNRNDYTLSFVIANNNPTENKFYPFGEEYYYDDNFDIEDIKEQIRGIIDDKIENIKEKNYADGGLIAPNGKPSKLTPEQYKLVRTPAFKQWFGDWENDPENSSKIVDENGEPLVVYHGTNSDDFYEFQNRLFGYRGFYFTDKKSVARNYGSNVRQFFLNSKDFVLEDMKGGSYAGNEWIDDLVENSEMDNKDVHLLNFIDPLDPSSMNRFPKSNIYIIFNKSNIKLADGSNTTFDSNNPDIRFDEGGELIGVVEIGNDIYISKNINELPKDSLIVEHRYFDEIKAGDIGFFTGEIDDVDSSFGDKVIYVSIGKNVKIKTIDSSYSYLEEKGILDIPNEYIIKKYGEYGINTYRQLSQEAHDYLNNPNDWYYEFQKKTLQLLKEDGEDFDVLEMLYEDESVPHQYLITKIDIDNPNIRYDDGGLIAPNGKPSNLTPEQYELVRTPEFKAWFGDWENSPETASKVVDSNGEPLVVYHGTDVKFNQFDLTKVGEGSDLLGKGIYLTENKKVAEFYANLVAKKRYIKKYEEGILGSENPIYEDDASKKAKKHEIIYDFFINAKNIVDINELGVDKKTKEIIVNSIRYMFQDKSENYVNERIDFAIKNKHNIKNYRGLIIYLIEQFPDAKNQVVEYLKNKYDGFIFEPTSNFEISEIDYQNYVVFNPNQIKLADGTNTTFDSNNPDIRYAGGGSVNSGAFKKWFGNSRVVDKKGNPLIVYHGSPDLRGLKEKYIFESRFLDNQSFFFTDNYSMAKSYADPKRAFDYQNAEEGVIGLYLSLQNPLIVNAFNQIWRKFEITIDGNEIIGTRNLINFAKKKGYDSVIVENVRDYYNNNDKKTKGGNVYVAFYPNQIKLANGSNTTFDSNNPDIRFDGGGVLPDNIFDYLKEKGFEPLGNGLRSKSNCTIKMDFSNVLYQAQNDNRVWISPIEYSDYKKAFTILEFHCRDKNKGIGTAVLEEIIQGADLFGYTIFIEPTSMKKYRVETDINTDDLKRWYSKFDFKPINNNYSNYVWLRSPKNPDIS